MIKENILKLTNLSILKKLFTVNYCLLFAILGGCGLTNEIMAVKPLRNDLNELLDKHGIDDTVIECKTNIATRKGICTINEISQPFNQLIERLNLIDFKAKAKSIDPENPSNLEYLRYYEYWSNFQNAEEILEQHDCRAFRIFADSKKVKIYGSLGRSSKVRLSHGGAFDEFIVFYRSDTNSACINLSYAYG